MADAPYDPYVPKAGADQSGGQSRTQALQGVSLLRTSQHFRFGRGFSLEFEGGDDAAPGRALAAAGIALIAQLHR